MHVLHDTSIVYLPILISYYIYIITEALIVGIQCPAV